MRNFAESAGINLCETAELAAPVATEARTKRPLLSIVLPCYNEEEVLRETVSRLTLLCGELSELDVEIIFINNASSDGTWALLKSFSEKDPRIKLISLARNFGYQISTTAGIDASRGDAVVIMDADLQDPPELIPQMIAKWREGYDVIYGTRSVRLGESPLRMLVTRWFYRFLNWISDTPIPLDTGDFRLMGRNVVNTLKAMPERDRFIRGMVSWIGFRQVALPYKRAERFAGTSKFPWSNLFEFALDGIASFSTTPLRISVALGLICAVLALLGILYALYIRLFTEIHVEGWAALMISILFIGGVQLVSLGILGEYVGRIYNEIKHRPLYVAQEYVGFDQYGPAMSRSPVVDSK
jgi:glycosyltransferase involved in cell wall biosynthesis